MILHNCQGIIAYFCKTSIFLSPFTKTIYHYSEVLVIYQVKESKKKPHKYRYNDGIKTVTATDGSFVDKKPVYMV